MHSTHGWLVLSSLAIASAVGCTGSQAVTRGQSPGAYGPPAQAPFHGPAMQGHPMQGHPMQGMPVHGPVRHAGHTDHDALCPPGGCPAHGGYPGGYPGDCYGGAVHGHPGYGPHCPPGPTGWDGGWGEYDGADDGVEYKVPQNLAYPPPQVPPSFVQYPYYAVRGPTDFFMQ